MSRSAQSVFYFGHDLALLGILLIFYPYSARVVDAYGAVLAADSPTGTPVRRTILDVADDAGAPGSNNRFDEKDVQLLLSIIQLQAGTIDYSRYDLNGDGRTGGGGTERFDLDPTKKTRTYSKGNRQKISLISAFASNADLLLLDEPSSGLDPLMENIFQQCVAEAARRGTTVLLSSHILAETERLYQRVTIIRAGRTSRMGFTTIGPNAPANPRINNIPTIIAVFLFVFIFSPFLNDMDEFH